jgi:peptide deformylase
MSAYPIRIVGDPVLRQEAKDVTEIDGRLVQLIDDMFVTMYDAPGIGLAAPQVGVQRRFFVYDVDEDPQVLINPRITGSDGEWWYTEGCLSIPGLHFEICRPKQIEVTGIDLAGNEISIEADELLARMFQHEIDHLDGVLMHERLEGDDAKEAKRLIREFQMEREDRSVAEAEPLGQKRAGFRLR